MSGDSGNSTGRNSTTSTSANGHCQQRTLENIARFSALGPTAIDTRLEELDQEWPLERILAAKAAGMSITGLTLGLITRNKRWLLLPAVATYLLLMNVVDGQGFPSVVLRKFGFRPQREIDDERTALKTLRGDFADFQQPARKHSDARRAWDAARA